MPSDPATPTTYARYSDGESAGARDCKVGLTRDGVTISFEDGTPNKHWPYRTLRTSEPIRSHAIDVLLNSSHDPGASVFVPDAAFAAKLAKHAPALTLRAERLRSARPWLIVIGCLVAVVAVIQAIAWSPAQTLAQAIPESWRDRLGGAAVTQVTMGKPKCVASDGIAALQALSNRLSAATGSDARFIVAVYDIDFVNAFAVPGNQIVISRGLIEKARSSDEVAGVLAHEMGHGLELHPETGIIRTVGMAAAIEVMLGGSGGSMGQLGLLLARLGYTRAAEREADVHALKILRAAEVSPAGLADFFLRVDGRRPSSSRQDGPEDRRNSDGENRDVDFSTIEIFRTHPAARERAALVRKQPAYDATPALTPSQWRALQTICLKTKSPSLEKAADRN